MIGPPGDMDSDRLLRVEQVAERLDISVETVRRWLRSGHLRGVRLGGTKAGWRIPESEVWRLLSGSSFPAPTTPRPNGQG